MNTEQLNLKGVKNHFTGQEVLFSVESLKEHFDGLLIHESDIIEVSRPLFGPEGDYEKVKVIRASDVNFDSATANEVAPKGDVEVEEKFEDSEDGTKGIVSELSPEEADALIKGENAKLDVVVTEETLDDNPELGAEGFVVGETITVDAEEVVSEPIVEAPKVEEVVPKKARKTSAKK